MEDGDAQFSVGVDVGVEEGMCELKGRRRVRVVGREFHNGQEVAAIVERVWIDDNEGDLPVEDVVAFELQKAEWSA